MRDTAPGDGQRLRKTLGARSVLIAARAARRPRRRSSRRPLSVCRWKAGDTHPAAASPPSQRSPPHPLLIWLGFDAVEADVAACSAVSPRSAKRASIHWRHAAPALVDKLIDRKKGPLPSASEPGASLLNSEHYPETSEELVLFYN